MGVTILVNLKVMFSMKNKCVSIKFDSVVWLVELNCLSNKPEILVSSNLCVYVGETRKKE